MSPRTCTQHNSHRRWQWSVWCNWPRHTVLSSSWSITSSRGSKGGTEICPRRSLRHFSASNCGKNPCELNTTNAIPLPVVQREQESIPMLHLGWFQLLHLIFLLWINHHFWPESLWFNTQRLLTKHELVFFTDDKPEKGNTLKNSWWPQLSPPARDCWTYHSHAESELRCKALAFKWLQNC